MFYNGFCIMITGQISMCLRSVWCRWSSAVIAVYRERLCFRTLFFWSGGFRWTTCRLPVWCNPSFLRYLLRTKTTQRFWLGSSSSTKLRICSVAWWVWSGRTLWIFRVWFRGRTKTMGCQFFLRIRVIVVFVFGRFPTELTISNAYISLAF